MDLWQWTIDSIKSSPEIAIFLTLGLGYYIGNIKLGNFSLGPVTGTLLSGVIIGQLAIEISPQIKSIFFIMFLFAVGFGVGPQFVRGLANNGIKQALFAVVISVLCLFSVFVVAAIAGYGPGYAVGLLAGTQTISASIGLATNAISHSSLGHSAAQEQLNNIPVAYAVTYLFGTVGTGWIIAFLGPKILKVDLEKECARYEKEMSAGEPDGGIASAWFQYEYRAYKLDASNIVVGKTIGEAEKLIGNRVFIERLRRKDSIVEPKEDMTLEVGDTVVVSGRTEHLIKLLSGVHEIADKELLQIPTESMDVVVTSKQANNKTLLELSSVSEARGVYINRIRRGSQGVDIPVKAQTEIHRGDIVSVSGSKKHVEAIVEEFGFADRPSSTTDMVFVSFGIVIGGLLGSIIVPVDGIPLTLSTSGGALIVGLIFGWLRSFKPVLGNVPTATLWFMNSVGLNVFIAVVGITAGPTFINGVKSAGVSLFFYGIIATSIPMIIAPLVGKYIFKFDPAINLGCCGGARTSTASVAMVADVSKSNVPMLGYTVPYAVSNTLLTLWGLFIVFLVL